MQGALLSNEERETLTALLFVKGNGVKMMATDYEFARPSIYSKYMSRNVMWTMNLLYHILSRY